MDGVHGYNYAMCDRDVMIEKMEHDLTVYISDFREYDENLGGRSRENWRRWTPWSVKKNYSETSSVR